MSKTSPYPRYTRAARDQHLAKRGFLAGYSSALADILTALEDGGEDAARQWIATHYDEEAHRP